MRRICLIFLAILCMFTIAITVCAIDKEIEKNNEQNSNTVTTVTENGNDETQLGIVEKLIIIIFAIILLSFIVSFIVITIYRCNHYSKLYHKYMSRQ